MRSGNSKKVKVFKSHNRGSCWNCGGDFYDEWYFPQSGGKFSVACRKCGETTTYRLEDKNRKAAKRLMERWKGPEEPEIRAIVSKSRKEYQTPYKQPPTERFANYGDCGFTSMHVVHDLRAKYPSAREVGGTYDAGPGKYDPDKSDHAWVEIPDKKIYVDPTYDQYAHPNQRAKLRNVRGMYPNSVVKIGSTNDPEYKDRYYDERKPWRGLARLAIKSMRKKKLGAVAKAVVKGILK